MVDLHCHILHGLDDGPETFEESLAMVRMAAGSGTTDLVATPHASPEFAFHPDLVAQRIQDLAATAVPGIRIHPGCDFHLSFENLQHALASPATYTVNHRDCLLVEFSDFQVPPNAGAIFGRLRAAGIRPILTHPERHPLLQERIEDLAAWSKEGCCMQITAQSLLGHFGDAARQAAASLIRAGLAHFVASDAHNCVSRPPLLRDAYNHVAAEFGEPAAELLFVVNPLAALEGEPVQSLRPRRKWYRFWT